MRAEGAAEGEYVRCDARDYSFPDELPLDGLATDTRADLPEFICESIIFERTQIA